MSTEIHKDIDQEFKSLKQNLSQYLNSDFDIEKTKIRLQTHIASELSYKAEILLGTLLNYLMNEAKSSISHFNVETQNAFYELDLRKTIHNWVSEAQNRLSLTSDIVKYSSDPRFKSGAIAGITTFILGGACTSAAHFATSATSTVAAAGTAITGGVTAIGLITPIVGGIITLVLSALAFKFGYNKAVPQARINIEQDIDDYLAQAKEDMSLWLGSVKQFFESELENFCSSADAKVAIDV